MGGPLGPIVGLTSSGIFDGQLNLFGKNLYGEVYIPNVTTITQATVAFKLATTGTFSFIYDGNLNICGVNNLSDPRLPDRGPIYGTVSFIGLTTSALGPTGPNGTASINGIYDGGVNIFGFFDSVNLLTHIPGLTSSSNF